MSRIACLCTSVDSNLDNEHLMTVCGATSRQGNLLWADPSYIIHKDVSVLAASSLHLHLDCIRDIRAELLGDKFGLHIAGAILCHFLEHNKPSMAAVAGKRNTSTMHLSADSSFCIFSPCLHRVE